MSTRAEVFGEQIRQVISTAIHLELRDPRLRDVTITRVKMSPDLQYADIRYSCFDETRDIRQVATGLDRAKGALKRLLANKIRMRKIPQLRFHYDEDIEAERRIEKLLQEIQPKST